MVLYKFALTAHGVVLVRTICTVLLLIARPFLFDALSAFAAKIIIRAAQTCVLYVV